MGVIGGSESTTTLLIIKFLRLQSLKCAVLTFPNISSMEFSRRMEDVVGGWEKGREKTSRMKMSKISARLASPTPQVRQVGGWMAWLKGIVG